MGQDAGPRVFGWNPRCRSRARCHADESDSEVGKHTQDEKDASRVRDETSRRRARISGSDGFWHEGVKNFVYGGEVGGHGLLGQAPFEVNGELEQRLVPGSMGVTPCFGGTSGQEEDLQSGIIVG